MKLAATVTRKFIIIHDPKYSSILYYVYDSRKEAVAMTDNGSAL
jgi:hypothetical protein